MEASLMSSSRHSAIPNPDLLPFRNPGTFNYSRLPSRIGFHPRFPAPQPRTAAAIRLASVAVRSDLTAAQEKASPSPSLITNKPAATVPLFVGLPLDAVSAKTGVNHAKAIAAGLRALKLLGVHGVELPVWWAAVQPDSSDGSDWSAYLAIATAARDAGLRLRVSLNLHSPASVPLPSWIERAAIADPDILFTDRSGRRHPGCLSFAVDEIPVLDGVTPLQAFKRFFDGFRSAFSSFLGSTITDISVSLGPDGELRYPSFPSGPNRRRFTGVGQFQCYDKYILASLKKHAEAAGNPLWGLGGPHDAPEYNQTPDGFFKEHGGSWETPYGDFFLSWYSGELLSHGDRILGLASKVFGDLPVRLSGRVPLLHNWHNTRSRPAELTAGFYSTAGRDGYEAVAEMFARNSCTMVLPGMDLRDADQPQGLRSSPELLLAQIMRACERHGVRVAGESSSLARGIAAAGFNRIKENLSTKEGSLDSFTYQRMGAYFFSPEHWPRFTEFVRSLALPELDSDDLLDNEEEETVSLPMDSAQARAREMQAV